MILACGRNQYHQLGAKSNNKDCIFKEAVVNPPAAIDFDASLVSSFSCYMNHTVIITKNAELFGIGDNSNNEISSSLPKQLKKFTKFNIIDSHNQPCIPISAVCGAYYTLYLVIVKGSSIPRLVYSSTIENEETSLFLNTKDMNLISLFGGENNSAAIDTEGSMVFMMRHFSIHKPYLSISFHHLPGNEKAVSIACCNEFYAVLSESGKVFISHINISSPGKFELITELNGIKIVQLNGLNVHCFAVSSKGRVFAFGKNFYNCIGFGDDDIKFEKFIEIAELNGTFIKDAYCGYLHSLFLTSDGKILVCGSNDYGELPLDAKLEKNVFYYINESVVKSEAEFCVIGNGCSFIFVGCNPLRSPNKRITNFNPLTTSSLSEEKEKNEMKNEIKNELEKLRKENAALQEKLKSLNEENKTLKSDNKSLKTKNKSLDEENELLKSDNKSLKTKNKALKKQITELEEKKSEVNMKEDSKIEHFYPKEMKIFDVESIEKLRKIESVGRGGQSEVFKISRREICALKILDLNQRSSKSKTKKKSTNIETDNYKSLKRFLQEYEIINNLNHKNIIKTYGICFGDEDHAPSILFEFCPFNLNDLIEDMSSTEKVIAIYELCLAMNEVHRHGLIHRDLKPENILFDDEKHVKLSDFGISCIVDLTTQTQSKTSGVGTLKFMAPELLQENTHYNEKVDVYSFGVVLFFVVTGGSLPKISIVDTAMGKKAKIPDDVNQISRDLINKCWSLSPDERPSFTEIIELIKTNKFKLINGVEKKVSKIESFLYH